MHMYVGLRKISVNFDLIIYPFLFGKQKYGYPLLYKKKTNTNIQYSQK